MKRGGGKAKGSAFEREICKRLGTWVSRGTATDVFWRSAMSGGRSTVGLKRGEKLARQAGDITSVSPEGHQLTDHFYIELKFYKELRFRSFVLLEQGKLADFWRHTVMQARAYERVPLLIAKQNNVPPVVIAPTGMIPILAGKSAYDESLRRTTVRIADEYCEVCLLDDLLGFPFKYKQPRVRLK